MGPYTMQKPSYLESPKYQYVEDIIDLNIKLGVQKFSHLDIPINQAYIC